MAWSIQVVAGKSEVLHDLDILALLSLIQTEIDSNIDGYSALASFESAWRESLETYGPGTLELDLERLSSDPQGVAQFRHLLSKVRSRLVSFGELVPAVAITTGRRNHGVRFSDYKTSMLVAALDQLETLLQHGEEAAQRASRT
jgi:hypothetical protein